MSVLLEHGALIIALLNFAFTILAGAIGVYVKFALAEMQAKLHEAISDAGQEIDERIDQLRRETGETFAAFRTKIGEVENKVYNVELYVRDNYVRYDSFQIAIDKLDKQLVRMEAKLDQLRGDR